MLQFFNHYRKESQSEVYNLRFPQNVFRAESVMPNGSCCWEICSNQDVCQQLQSGIQNNLEFRYIKKINIVSCQENGFNSAVSVKSSQNIFNVNLIFVSWVLLCFHCKA